MQACVVLIDVPVNPLSYPTSRLLLQHYYSTPEGGKPVRTSMVGTYSIHPFSSRTFGILDLKISINSDNRPSLMCIDAITFIIS